MAGYLGDGNTKIVHHLANKQKGCNIFTIKKMNCVYFTPDLLENALKKGFNPCKYCN